MAYSMPYTKVEFTNGDWFVHNANGIITLTCEGLQQWTGKHKGRLLAGRADKPLKPEGKKR